MIISSRNLKWILLLLTVLCFVDTAVLAQSKKAGRYQWQYDLKRAERQLRKIDAANRNDDRLLRLAEVKFYQGKILEAYPLYRKADSLGLVTTLDQQRNYVYAAIRSEGFSPFAVKSNYFQLDTGNYAVNKFNVNTAQEDFAPYVWKDKVFVTSSRPTPQNRRKQSYLLTRFPYLDVYAFNRQAEKSNVDFLPKFLNGPFHDGPLAIAADTSMVFLTRNYDLPDKNGTHHLYITVYRRQGNKWSGPERLQFCEPTFTVQHPFYDDTSGKLYFSSNMAGGKGGFDLYTTTWNGNKWTNPVNLGHAVNSIFDEVFPSLNPAGHLVFASNHIESMGGLDLVVFENGQRKLLPAPINSIYDDFAISYSGQNSGYFTSNRGNAGFDDDIWHFQWEDMMQPKQYFLSVLDAVTGENIRQVRVHYDVKQASKLGNVLVDMDRIPLDFLMDSDSLLITSATDEALRDIRRVIYERQGDSLVWIKVLLEPKQIEGTQIPLTTAVYFHNDRPKVQDLNTKTDYGASLRMYSDSLPNYFARSADPKYDFEVFWEKEVNQGWRDLQAMQKAIASHLSQGGSIELRFSGFCSPLHTDDYNVQLAKRRVQVVQQYLIGDARPSAKVNIKADYLGEAKANPEVSDELSNTPLSVYSIAASRERKVEVKVIFK